MITLSVNGESRQVNQDCLLSHALEQWEYSGEMIAVAINGEFVPRGQYQTCRLAENDCIDIVAPIQGG